MSAINQAFIFVKPHAVNSEYVQLYIDMVFKLHDIKTVSTGMISGPTIKEKGLIDRHYAVNAHIGTIQNPSNLFVPQTGLQKFQDTFGITWQLALDQNRIISGQNFQNQKGWTSEELYDKWEKNGFTKICSGIYVGFFREDNLYVLNGFYPSNRDMFTADNTQIRWSVIEFSPEKLSWFDFRHNIIGITDPENAAADSIRGFLYANKEKAGINVSYKENIIHASASPFEALIEKCNWLEGNFDPIKDPLFQELSKDHLNIKAIKKLYHTNPTIEYDSIKDTLVNILEDKNTKQNVEIIRSIS